MTRVLSLVAALVLMTCGAAAAGDFDGSKLLICAPVEAMDCGPGEGCTKERPEDVGAPNFLRIDIANNVIVGPKQTTPILLMDKSDDQILLQGKELGYAWTLVLDQESGTMTVTLVNREAAFVLFGPCTPL
jgi:hypothetical protein